MFTGLIETTGKITAIMRENKSAVIAIQPNNANLNCKIGDSVALNGVCLTIEKIDGAGTVGNFCLSFRAVSETLSKTTFVNAKIGDTVNMERAMLVSGRLDGHIVLGHIDTTAKITKIINDGDSTLIYIALPAEFAKFIAKKGSVTIDGISLTVADLTDNNTFVLSIIPHSLTNTTLQYKRVGDLVNVECDVLARYIERMLNFNDNKNNDEKLLQLLERGEF